MSFIRVTGKFVSFSLRDLDRDGGELSGEDGRGGRGGAGAAADRDGGGYLSGDGGEDAGGDG